MVSSLSFAICAVALEAGAAPGMAYSTVPMGMVEDGVAMVTEEGACR